MKFSAQKMIDHVEREKMLQYEVQQWGKRVTVSTVGKWTNYNSNNHNTPILGLEIDSQYGAQMSSKLIFICRIGFGLKNEKV